MGNTTKFIKGKKAIGKDQHIPKGTPPLRSSNQKLTPPKIPIRTAHQIRNMMAKPVSEARIKKERVVATVEKLTTKKILGDDPRSV